MISTLRYLRWNRSIKYSFTVSVSTAKTTSLLPNEDDTVEEAVRIKPSIGGSVTNKQSADEDARINRNFISSEADLSRALKLYIGAFDIDQKILSNELGMSESSLSRLLAGKTVSMSALGRIIEWLTREEGKKE